MSGRARVFAGVAVGRAVATQSGTALLTGAQMHPLRSDFYALGAFADGRLLNRINRIEVRAAAIGHLRLLLFEAASRRWTPATAIPPSPTAAAQRFTDPDRTSPAAKIPGRLVSKGVG